MNKYKKLSPFELKDTLIKLANKNGKMLNAGRGNPNFFNTFVRKAFAEFQILILKLSKNIPHPTDDIMIFPKPDEFNYDKELRKLIKKVKDIKIRKFLLDYISFFKKDNKKLYDVVLSALGTFYPSPPQIQPHLEDICEEYMYQKMVKKRGFEFFACEGAAAGILYVFNTLFINNLMRKHDKIAIVTPIFSPYLEIPKLHKYDMKIVELKGNPDKMYELDKKELDKLKDKNIKVLFLVNPTNPSEFSLPSKNIRYIKNIVKNHNKDLIVVTDNVYSPFVEKFDPLISALPDNTILIQSLSKYFGVTGWRLGVVMIKKGNKIDKMIKNTKQLSKRYSLISLKPEKLTFMERLVADSREVAEGHVAGLSTPQQVILGMFLFYDLQNPKYKKMIHALLEKRMVDLYGNIGIKPKLSPLATNYYTLLDIPKITEKIINKKAKTRLLKRDYLEFLFHLAKKYNVVLLPGKGFGTTEWVVRVSLANLETKSYIKIGKSIHNCIKDLSK